jgi:hypothetical protein
LELLVVLFSRFCEIVAEQQAVLPVRFPALLKLVHERHTGINEVKLYPVDFGSRRDTAYFVLHDEPENDMRESAHEPECFNARIAFCQHLREDPHEFNFVMTKELMHVFDSADERVTSKERFIQLLNDAERMSVESATAEWRADIWAYWRALVVLCPKSRRDELKAKLEAQEITEIQVAEEFLIPERMVRSVMGVNFEKSYARLILD